jgi:hypothetical protein
LSRSLRTAVTMLFLMGILAGLAYFGWVGLTDGWFDDDAPASEEAASPSESCTTPPPVVVRAQRTRVSVFNAGAPEGQAGEVMDALTEQGFRPGELTDAPEGLEVEGIVVWRRGAEPAQARLVRQQFRRARMVDGAREPLGPGVNVLVGLDFDDLSPRAPRSIRITRPEVCEPAA